MRNYVVLDLETSGTDPSKGHEIVQVSAKAIVGSSLANHSAGQITLLLKPQNPDKADPKAIEVIGKDLWEKALKEGLEPKVALKHLYEWIIKCGGKNKYDRAMMVGHNAKFDFDFLNFYFFHYKITPGIQDDLPYHFNFLDTLQAMHFLWSADNPANYRLDTLLALMGESRVAANHDAEEDVALTASIFVRLMKFFRQCRKQMKIRSGGATIPKEAE